MRAFALLLILANVASLTWQQRWLSWLPWQPEQFEKTTPTVASTKSSLTQLTLLNEHQATTTKATENSSDPVNTSDSANTIVPVKKVVEEKVVEKKPASSPTSDTVAMDSKTVTEKASQHINAVDESEKTTIPLKNSSEETPHEAVSASAETLLGQPDKEAVVKETTEIVTAKTIPDSQNPPAAVVEIAPPTSQTAPESKTATSDPPHAITALTASSTKIVVPPPISTEKAEKPAVVGKEPARNDKNPSPKKALAQSKSKPKSTAVCLQVGPYPQAKAAESTSKWFEGRKNVIAQVQKRQIPVLKRTLVYLPPFKNRTEALNAQKRLIQQGVNDHMVLTDKKMNNAISLGVYRDQLSVKRRFEELGGKGYKNVKTEKYYESDTKYWLSVRIPTSQNKLVSSFKKEFKGLPMISTACEE
ncbi:MAG: hypothetical protein BWK79_11435 [Beggiatoa sp. IS2]|nr:MAG: hypothetical protein BWK79_11435 [Beggiatoa sp. IS2]